MKKGNLKYSSDNRSGYCQAVSPENAPLKFIEFGTLRLARGEDCFLPCKNKEIAFLLLSGRCSIEAGNEQYILGPRNDIFLEPPSTLYARGIPSLSVTALTTCEAVVSTAAFPSQETFLKAIPPEQVVSRAVGADTYSRVVRTVIGEEFPAKRLLLGETLNEAGKWSSYPPHRHEKDSPPHEARLEEVFYYRMEKPNGFGVQRIYTDDGRINETYTVRDGDICILPRGYHPISASPSSKVYYFWVLAGKNRKMQVRVDPNFA